MLEGWLSEELFNAIPAVSFVFLDHNYFELSLPSSFYQLTSLVTCTLDNNFFTGSLPEQLGALLALEQFYLEENDFSGSLPSTMGRLSNLSVLRLDSNHFTGYVPDVFMGLQRLDLCYFYLNHFSGSVPASLLTVSSLDDLLISSNSFTPSLPAIAQSPQLQILDVSFNFLDGVLNLLGSMPLLDALIVNSNLLTGCLPETASFSASRLQYLNFSSNYFSQTLPSNLQYMDTISIFDVSNNFFGGSGNDIAIFRAWSVVYNTRVALTIYSMCPYSIN